MRDRYQLSIICKQCRSRNKFSFVTQIFLITVQVEIDIPTDIPTVAAVTLEVKHLLQMFHVRRRLPLRVFILVFNVSVERLPTCMRASCFHSLLIVVSLMLKSSSLVWMVHLVVLALRMRIVTTLIALLSKLSSVFALSLSIYPSLLNKCCCVLACLS